MKFFGVFLVLWLILLGDPAQSATLERVLITPASAKLWFIDETDKNQVTIEIPPQAITETFGIEIIEPKDVKVLRIVEEQQSERSEKEIRELLDKIKALEKELELLKTSQRILHMELESWQKQRNYKREKVEDVVAFLEASRNNIDLISKKIVDTSFEIKEKEEELKRLRERFEKLTGNQEKAKVIKCILSESSKVKFRYHYVMEGASWSPIYRIELIPSKEEISFTMEGEITQKSGFDWNNVDIELATSEEADIAEPPALPPWIVEIHRPLPREAKLATMEKALSIEPTERPAFAVFKLEKQTIPSGERTIVLLYSSKWKAKTLYLLRPFVSSKAFIQSEAKFDKPMQFPNGKAMLLLDGVLVAQTSLAIQGLKHTFFFGTDPIVTSQMFIEEKQAGHKGLIKGRKTFLWKWYYEIENGHNFPITVKIEERKPQKRDESINITVLEIPDKPTSESEDPNLWTWEFPMKEKEKVKLGFKIQVDAPEEVELSPGW